MNITKVLSTISFLYIGKNLVGNFDSTKFYVSTSVWIGKGRDRCIVYSLSSKMRFIDIGVNLFDEMFDGYYHGCKRHQSDISNVLDRSKKAGVESIIITAGSLEEANKALQLCNLYDPSCTWLFCTIGVHPTKCKEFLSNEQNYIEELRKLIKQNMERIVAYGEFGLDFDRLHFCDKDTQLRYFELQLNLVEEFKIPMFLHMRAASDPFFEILERNKSKWFASGGVIHSFTGSKEDINRIKDNNMYISLNGCSLKTESNLMNIKSIPLDYLLLETDSPWCSIRKCHASYNLITNSNIPKAMKPKRWSSEFQIIGRNEPANIIQVAEVVYKLVGESMTFVEFCNRIVGNTLRLFPLICNKG